MARHSWRPMGKSVEPFWRYAQVAEGANRRLIDALANAPLTGEATQELDELCRSRDRTRVARFNPVDAHTVLLFIAVLSGEFAITGLRNRDLQAKLFDTAPPDDRGARRRTHQTPPAPPSERKTARTPIDHQDWKIPPLPRHSPRHQSHVARHPLPQERFSDRFPKIGQRRLLKLPRSCHTVSKELCPPEPRQAKALPAANGDPPISNWYQFLERSFTAPPRSTAGRGNSPGSSSPRSRWCGTRLDWRRTASAP